MGVKNLFARREVYRSGRGDRRSYYLFHTTNGYLVAAPQGFNSYALTVIQAEAPDQGFEDNRQQLKMPGASSRFVWRVSNLLLSRQALEIRKDSGTKGRLSASLN